MNGHRDDLALRLFIAERRGEPLPSPQSGTGRLSVPDAYAVQAARNALALENGDAITGWKVGLTSPGARQAFGADEPMRGVLFRRTRLPAAAEMDLADLCAPRLEGEILLRIKEAPPADADDAALLASIASVHAAFEVADSRFDGWRFGVADAVADNACCARFGYVAAGVAPSEQSLGDVTMTIHADGAADPVSAGGPGVGSDSPLGVYRWLIESLARDGLALEPGQVVLTGALGPMAPIEADRSYHVRLSGLGALNLATRRTGAGVR